MKARISLYLILSSFLLIIILILSGIFHLPWLRFNKITVSNNERVSESEIRDKVFSVIFGKPLGKYLGLTHMLLWRDINISDPIIEKINLERDWFNQTVNIEVVERKSYAVWCLKTICYWITKEGQILEKAPASEGQLINIIHSDAQPTISLKEKIAYLDTILATLKKLNVSILEIFYEEKTQELTIKTKRGLRLMFSLYFKPNLVIPSLEELLTKQKINPKEYLDFRTENKVYYK